MGRTLRFYKTLGLGLAVSLLTSCLAVEDPLEKKTSASSGGATLTFLLSNVLSYANVRSPILDSQGNIFFADINHNEIRKVTPAGVNTVFASGFDSYLLAIDANDNVFAAPWSAGTVHKIAPDGTVSTVGTMDLQPSGFAIDSQGNLYYTAEPSNVSNHVIKKMTQSGVVTVFAGTGSAGFVNGNGTSAAFNDPRGLAIDAQDNVFVVDAGNSVIRKISSTGNVTTFAGSGVRGTDDGTDSTATFSFRYAGAQTNAIAVSAGGDVFVGQAYHSDILRKISNGVVTTYCGNGSEGAAIEGSCLESPFYSSGTLAPRPDGSLVYDDGYGSIVVVTPE